MRYLQFLFLMVVCIGGLPMLLRAQDNFMLHGSLRVYGDSIKGARITIRPFEEKPDYQKIDDNKGLFRIFLKYGKEYVITFHKDGYVDLIYKVSTKLPASMAQCCQTPLDISCHLFKPGGKFDSVFLKPFIYIKYDTKLKSYNYSLDVDHYIKKLLERTVQERIARRKEAERKKRIADSMIVEKRYLEHVTKGNLFFNNKQYSLARAEYEEAHKVIPARQYPMYKSEDCKTEIERMNHREDSIARLNVDSIWKARQPDTSKPKTVYKRMTADEVRAKMIRDVQGNMKKLGATDEAITETFAYLDKAVTESRLAKGDSTPHPKLEPSRLDTTPTVAMPMPSIAMPEPEPVDQQTELKAAEMPFAEPKARVFDVKQYQDSLMQKYPNLRTVEVQRDDYKTVTRVIINKANHVDVFAKVEHKWGATFYFVENGPQKYDNISESYYKVSTMEEATTNSVAPTDSVK